MTTREARQLASTAEWTLIESSLPERISTLSPARLKNGASRARSLRDKYRDLAKRQHRRSQPKRSGRPGEALNARSTRKAKLFAEVLGRFTAETSRRSREEQAARRATAPGARKPKKSPSAAWAPAGRSAPPSKTKASRAPLVPKSAVAERSGQGRIHAHVSSEGRRRQARRDSR